MGGGGGGMFGSGCLVVELTMLKKHSRCFCVTFIVLRRDGKKSKKYIF